MNSEELSNRLFKFAELIIDIANQLPNTVVGKEIGRQLIRSGTSIGANYEEAQGAFSKQDFCYRVSICLKESKESNYWLKLINKKILIKNSLVIDAIHESNQLCSIFGSIVKTSKRK